MNASTARSAGFSLVEVTLALGVAAFSLLAVFALLAAGSQLNHTATEQTASTGVFTSVATDLRATPKKTVNSVQFGIPIPANPVSGRTATTLYFDSAGRSSTAQSGASRYRMVITFLPNAGAQSAMLVDLRLTWPATADPISVSTGAAEMFVALDRG